MPPIATNELDAMSKASSGLHCPWAFFAVQGAGRGRVDRGTGLSVELNILPLPGPDTKTRHKMSSLRMEAPSSQAGLLARARRNRFARVQTKQSVAFSMENGGWMMEVAPASWAGGLSAPHCLQGTGDGDTSSGKVGRRAQRRWEHFWHFSTSSRITDIFCTPAARGRQGMAPRVEPRDMGMKAEVNRAEYSPWGLTNSLGTPLPSPGAAPQ